jgi:hypothetical protein
MRYNGQFNKTVKRQQKMTLTERQKALTANITYTQAGVSCFVGQERSKFEVQFFVGSSVV